MRARLNVVDSARMDQEIINQTLQMEIRSKEAVIQQQRAWIERVLEDQLLERNGLDVRLKPEKPNRNCRF
ncbi:hypothetical protein M3Y98_01184000 [Aphelenchoides besseyi]|nr:hypothetical protein M3Y98_01184000 [Aphelenchoides besseyi]